MVTWTANTSGSSANYDFNTTETVGIKITSGHELIGKQVDSIKFSIGDCHGTPAGSLTGYITNSSGTVQATSTNTISPPDADNWIAATWNFSASYTIQADDQLVFKGDIGQSDAFVCVSANLSSTDSSIYHGVRANSAFSPNRYPSAEVVYSDPSGGGSGGGGGGGSSEGEAPTGDGSINPEILQILKIGVPR